MDSTKTFQTHTAQVLLEIGAVGFRPDEPVTFKSGILSPIYVDNRRLPFHPKAWRVVINAMRSWIREHELAFDAVAGIEAAGIPHSAALGYTLERPSLFVRKQPKGHGKGQQIEGGDVDGLRVLLIEDLITTGGSSLAGVKALREDGAIVTDCMAIVSYEFEESTAAFAEAGVKLHILSPFSMIKSHAHEAGLFNDEVLHILEAWHASPYTWGKDE